MIKKGHPNSSPPMNHLRKRDAAPPVSVATIVFVLLFTNFISFIIGTTFSFSTEQILMDTGMMSPQAERSMAQQQQQQQQQLDCPPPPECPKVRCPENKKSQCPLPKECPEVSLAQQQSQRQELQVSSSSTSHVDNLFPEETDRFVVGMAHVPQPNFTRMFDLGVPIDEPKYVGESGVMIFYNNEKSMPNRYKDKLTKQTRLLSPEEATQNCDHMNVISTYHDAHHRRQCIALVPQYESYHIQKWLRVPEQGPGGPQYPLRIVPRGYSMGGAAAFHPPKHDKHTKMAWKMLETYLDSIDDIIQELTPIVDKIAIDNTIVVMVCNFGQSQLLANFACSAKSKGIDVSNVLVFATDQETKDLAEAVGLTAFFEKRNFGNMPKKAAKQYGDGAFTTMMLSKVICVHMASMLKVDFLFQDVDVLWYKNPLPYFHNKSSPIAHFDAYFQDDGSRSLRFSPFCANSGFYFIRHNERTQYFLTALLMQSDLVLRSFSHQSAMIAVLSEHASLFGLRVKTLGHAHFPSGYLYHRKKGNGPWGNYFVDLFDGKHDPYIFHMSWTKSHLNKILFYRQMDQWYLQDKCIDKEVSNIEIDAGSDFTGTCCSAEPLFSCHYKDKPSTRPCKDAPALDKDGKSYW